MSEKPVFIMFKLKANYT